MLGSQVAFQGNLGGDPDMKTLDDGTVIAHASVAVGQRKKVGDKWETVSTTWYRVSVWGREGEAFIEKARKGDKVVVVGRLAARDYEVDNEKRVSLDVNADAVGIVPTVAKKADEPEW